MGMEIFPNCFCNLVTDTTMTVILYHLLPRKSKFLTKQLYLRESDFPQTPPCPSCELAVQGPQRWAARKAGSTPTAGGARGMWLPLPLGSQQHKQAGPADKSEVTQTKDIKRFENSNNQTISSTWSALTQRRGSSGIKKRSGVQSDRRTDRARRWNSKLWLDKNQFFSFLAVSHAIMPSLIHLLNLHSLSWVKMIMYASWHGYTF